MCRMKYRLNQNPDQPTAAVNWAFADVARIRKRSGMRVMPLWLESGVSEVVRVARLQLVRLWVLASCLWLCAQGSQSTDSIAVFSANEEFPAGFHSNPAGYVLRPVPANYVKFETEACDRLFAKSLTMPIRRSASAAVERTSVNF